MMLPMSQLTDQESDTLHTFCKKFTVYCNFLQSSSTYEDYDEATLYTQLNTLLENNTAALDADTFLEQVFNIIPHSDENLFTFYQENKNVMTALVNFTHLYNKRFEQDYRAHEEISDNDSADEETMDISYNKNMQDDPPEYIFAPPEIRMMISQNLTEQELQSLQSHFPEINFLFKEDILLIINKLSDHPALIERPSLFNFMKNYFERNTHDYPLTLDEFIALLNKQFIVYMKSNMYHTEAFSKFDIDILTASQSL
jgi:hypothetical protein